MRWALGPAGKHLRPRDPIGPTVGSAGGAASRWRAAPGQGGGVTGFVVV